LWKIRSTIFGVFERLRFGIGEIDEMNGRRVGWAAPLQAVWD